jgi:glucose/mannose transport system permease protein
VTAGAGLTARLSSWLPKLALAPSFAAVLLFVYGFILFTLYLSFTTSRMLPVFDWLGFGNYVTLFRLSAWTTALENLAVFGGLYVVLCIVIGASLAIAIDQRIRAEGMLRAVYLYPMALSFIVTGTAWKWLLDPGVGLEQIMHDAGWESFAFGWIKDRDMAIYTVVIAAVWQSSGFIMALFLAGLRGISDEIVKAAQIDGATGWRLYAHVILPQLRPTLLSAIVILTHLAIKSYDLIIALTGGGPGRATELPATFMYSYTFTRNQMGIGASSAVVMLLTIAAVIVPYLYSELRARPHAR